VSSDTEERRRRLAMAGARFPQDESFPIETGKQVKLRPKWLAAIIRILHLDD